MEVNEEDDKINGDKNNNNNNNFDLIASIVDKNLNYYKISGYLLSKNCMVVPNIFKDNL